MDLVVSTLLFTLITMAVYGGSVLAIFQNHMGSGSRRVIGSSIT